MTKLHKFVSKKYQNHSIMVAYFESYYEKCHMCTNMPSIVGKINHEIGIEITMRMLLTK